MSDTRYPAWLKRPRFPNTDTGGPLHPQWGYRLDLVKDVECLHCDQPIGDEPYVEITSLARFGQMMFAHRRCDEDTNSAAARDRRGDSRQGRLVKHRKERSSMSGRIRSGRESSSSSNNGRHPARVDPRTIKSIRAWFDRTHPTWGVDRLVIDPFETIRMCIDVGKRLDLFEVGEAGPIIAMLDEIATDYPAAVHVIQRLARTAMNARKAKKLKPSQPSSPASIAAATRRTRGGRS